MPVRLQESGRLAHLGDRRPLVHRVEDLLGARLDPHPDLLGPGARERLDGRWGHQVDARLHREGDHRVAHGERVGEPLDPAVGEAEDVVGEPDVVGSDGLLQPRHLLGHVRGAALGVARPVERLRAPVAAVGAAARRHDVPRQAPVRLGPRRPVLRLVDEVPGGEREGVEVVDERARRGPHRGREGADGPRRERQPRNVGEVGERVALPPLHELEERPVGLAEDHGVGARADVEVGGVGGVRAVDGDEGARGLRVRGSSGATPRAAASCTSSSGS